MKHDPKLPRWWEIDGIVFSTLKGVRMAQMNLIRAGLGWRRHIRVEKMASASKGEK